MIIIENKEMIILKIILTIAGYTIYRVHMLCRFKAIRFNYTYLASQFEKEIIMNLKFLQKKKKNSHNSRKFDSKLQTL